ncbi:MAG: FtsW/RodA/SpoVE family cell cycle protein [Deltaproteobacteria bacterium]|nr:FtsW/RodA/SpoVE family cell cycle protein [Deltaproteobacteria bacterium]
MSSLADIFRDYMPLLLSILISVVGIITLLSATSDSLHEALNWFYVIRQSAYLVAGLSLSIIIISSRISLETWKGISVLCFLVSYLLTFSTLFSEPIKGSSRWISLGLVNVQPSEFLKCFSLVVYSIILSSPLSAFYMGALVLLVMLLLALPILLQPDLGTSILCAIYGWSAIFLTIGGRKFLFWSCLLVALLSPFFWNFFLKPYQKERILSLFVDDSLGSDWQVTQALIGVGSGGILGKGYFEGTQGRFELIPERHTDFIFSVFAEEFGFIGSIALLALYTIVCGWLIFAPQKNPNSFVKIFCSLSFVKLATEITVNLGMNLGILPVVGVALPFFSYGGSNLVSNYLLMGLVLVFHRSTLNLKVN